MELEELLILLQRYGVTSYADKDVKLEMVAAVDPGSDEDFQVLLDSIQFENGDFEPDPSN